ncbi:MAG: hypothetical protein HOQ44_18430 [Nocardia sp.]|nr:hypothetical protein [Nocardia sp.]
MSAVAVAGLLAGCGTDGPGTVASEPVYRGIAGSCTEMAAPAADAVRAYTGELFSAAVAFEEAGAPSTSPDLATKECRAIYAAEAAPAASPATGPPRRRVIHLRIALQVGESALQAAERHFDTACASVDCRITTGIGDESFEGAVEGSSATAVTMFRTGNAVVSVTVDGSNFASGPGGSDRAAEISELAPGARAIAQAMAADLGAVVT